MNAEQCLRDGNLEEAIRLLQDQVRKDPSDPKLRIFLFQLLCVLGEWDRALTQLKVAGELEAGALSMVQAYREALRCEVLRRKVFAGERSPLVFGDPDHWIALLMESVKLTAAGEFEKSQSLRDEAFEEAPATSGVIDDQPFEWIADADVRLGPVLEAIVNGRYYWVPFHRIREIEIEEPEDLRDSVWMPVSFTWANGGQTVGLVPTRYPGTEGCEDSLVRLARKTEWVERAEGVWVGQGQRMFATDAGEHSLMDVRKIVLDVEEEAPSDAEGDAGGASPETEAPGG